MKEKTVLVLSGGNALGAHQGGCYAALHDAGRRVDWIVGASVGAVNGAVIAGNPPGGRVEKLRRLWSLFERPKVQPAGVWPLPEQVTSLISLVQTSLMGRPAAFLPWPTGWLVPGAAAEGRVGLFDLGPMRRTLEELVDFDRLNSGETRLTVVATDVETGEEVRFDTREGRVGPEHIMASCAFLPGFRPVEIDGRLLADGGLCANLPVDAVLDEDPEGTQVCFAVDLFERRGERPHSLLAAANRRQEILFGNQTCRRLELYRRLHEARGGKAGRHLLLLLSCAAETAEKGVRAMDYSERSITRRWEAGAADMVTALRDLEALEAAPAGSGLVLHRVRSGQGAPGGSP